MHSVKCTQILAGCMVVMTVDFVGFVLLLFGMTISIDALQGEEKKLIKHHIKQVPHLD